MAKDLTYTGRNFTGVEAKQAGFVSKVVDSQEDCLKEALSLASLIASKSPVAVTATKLSLNYSRDHTVQEGLDHIMRLNSALLQTEDMKTAALAAFQKKKAIYPKL